MQAGDSHQRAREADAGASQSSIRSVLPAQPVVKTIFIVRPGRLFIKQQEAIDEHGFIEFEMVSCEGDLHFNFKVLPNEELDQEDLLLLALAAGNDLLVHAYADLFRKQYKGGKNGKA